MAEEKKYPPKVPTAQKRKKQDVKKQLLNRILKSKIHTVSRKLEKASHEKASKETLQQQINLAFSLVDKAVKKNIYHPNKGARIKSSFSKKYC